MEIPFIKGLPVLGSAIEFQKDPLAFIRKHEAQHPDLFGFRVGPNTLYFSNNADYAQHILFKNFKNYGKQNLMYREMAILFGGATSVVDGEKWKAGHEMIKPSLAMKRVTEFLPIIEKSFEGMLSGWEKRAAAGEFVDASADLAAATMSIIVNTMFGSNMPDDPELIGRSFRDILGIIVDRILSVLKFPLAVPTPQNLRYRRAIASIDGFIYRIIDEKLRANGAPVGSGRFQDILGEWIESLGPAAATSRKRLRDEVIGIFVAGHGSSATFLSWILYHLATQPEIQEDVTKELRDVLGGRTLEAADAGRLPLTRAVIEESMRLTPPGWVISRSTIAEDTLGPYRLPPGSMVLLSPYLLQNSPRYWERAEMFDPRRFLNRGDGFPANAFIPFTTGPRVCTGKSLAMIEATMLVAQTLRKYRLALKPGHRITPEGGFTLNLKGGLLLQLTKR